MWRNRDSVDELKKLRSGAKRNEAILTFLFFQAKPELVETVALDSLSYGRYAL